MATHFQPIFSARQKAVIGVEALARGVRADGSLVAPHHLFKMAAEEGLSTVVEGLCREAAVDTFTRLDARPDELLLFLNLDLVGQPNPEALPEELERLVARRGVAPTSVAVEFLEARLDDVGALREPRGGAARARLPRRARRRRRGSLEPRSHPAVPARRHQDRSQPHHGRRRRLLQAGDAQEPRRALAAHRRARRRRGHRDRGRGHRGARARRRSAPGLLPVAPAGRRRRSPTAGSRAPRARSRSSRASSRATWWAPSTGASSSTAASTSSSTGSSATSPTPRRRRSTTSSRASSPSTRPSSASTCSTTRACRSRRRCGTARAAPVAAGRRPLPARAARHRPLAQGVLLRAARRRAAEVHDRSRTSRSRAATSAARSAPASATPRTTALYVLCVDVRP